MDPNNLLQCFLETLNPETAIRSNAETMLKQMSSTPGFLGACLDIIAVNEVDNNVKLSASLYFKNKVIRGWSNAGQNGSHYPELVIYNEEKPVIKDLLLNTLLSCSKNNFGCIRVLKPALNEIISNDYVEKKWNELLPKSFELLSSNDMDSAYVGLLCLSEIFRTYRWKTNDARQELEHLIVQYFPDILQFANISLYQEGKNMNNPKIGEMLKLILKIYKFVTYYDLPFTLQRMDSFIPWANFFVSIIEKPLPKELLNTTDTDKLNNNSWVKCKKWAYANLYRIFQRYASQSLVKNFEYEDFRNVYVTEFLPQLMQLLFSQIELWGSKQLWLSDESIHYTLSFIEQCIVQKAAWPMVKPHYPVILQHVVFPLLCPDENSLDIFDNDPQEYIHRNMELWDDSYSPDLSAISLLVTAVSKRSKITLQPTLEFVIQTLQENYTDVSMMPLNNAVKVESCLRIFSSIIDRLIAKDKSNQNEIEGFLNTIIFPLFDSPHEFLKTRACEVTSKLGTVIFNDKSIIVKLHQGVMKCMNEDSDCLPVKLLASLALQAFIHDPEFQQLLSPMVVPTMQNLLKLSNEFESDAISGVMQDFVEQFSEQLQPFGMELMSTLVQQFLKIAVELHAASNVDPNNFGDTDDLPDESDKQMAALGILSTTISILLSFENSPQMVKTLEETFYPAAEFILKNDIEDFYRECSEFYENSTFLLRSISPVAWKILEWIGECNRKEDSMIAFYLEDFMPVLNNYLIHGKEELNKNSFYSNILFEIYSKAIANTEQCSLDETSVIFDYSQKLMLTLNVQLPSKLREKFLQDTVDAIISEKQDLKKNVVFGVTSFNVIISSIISSGLVTLQFLKQNNLLEFFFEVWFSFFIPNYKRVYDIKLSIMGLLSILNIEEQQFVNLSLNNLLTEIGSLLITSFAKFPQALKNFEEKRKEFTANALDDEAGLWTPNIGDDVENDDEEDDAELEEYMRQLQNGTNPLDLIADKGDGLEDFDDLEEDPLNGSVLDEVNVYEALKSSFSTMSQTPQKYQAVVGSLPNEYQQDLNQLLQL